MSGVEESRALAHHGTAICTQPAPTGLVLAGGGLFQIECSADIPASHFVARDDPATFQRHLSFFLVPGAPLVAEERLFLRQHGKHAVGTILLSPLSGARRGRIALLLFIILIIRIIRLPSATATATAIAEGLETNQRVEGQVSGLE